MRSQPEGNVSCHCPCCCSLYTPGWQTPWRQNRAASLIAVTLALRILGMEFAPCNYLLRNAWCRSLHFFPPGSSWVLGLRCGFCWSWPLMGELGACTSFFPGKWVEPQRRRDSGGAGKADLFCWWAFFCLLLRETRKDNRARLFIAQLLGANFWGGLCVPGSTSLCGRFKKGDVFAGS